MTSEIVNQNDNQTGSTTTCAATRGHEEILKTKIAIVILSDPAGESQEALGRLFNGLAAAREFIEYGDETKVIFQGAGARWISKITQPDHPVHALFELVRSKVEGVSCGCADVFASSDEVKTCGFELLTDNRIPGTSGMASLRGLIQEGYTILTF